MRLNNCNCGERIDCGCTVSFDSYQANSVSVLSVGNLIGGSCTFDAYVIDWYVDGQRALVSGKGNDPAIQAHHPFIGSAAIPVIGGTWVPKIRYVVIGGEIIYNGYRKCDRWCDSLGGLPSMNVSSLGCGMRNLPTNNLYDYRLTYNTSQDFSLASRTIRFDLPNDQSALYFAFNFIGYDVSDQVDIFFKDSETPLTSWIVGTRFTTNWWQSMPYRRNTTAGHKVAIALPEYQPGDYLIIKVTPSVMEQNYNTNWQLDLKCLGNSYVFACDYFTLAHKTITSLDLVHDVANCRYQLRASLQEPAGNWNQAAHPFYWMVQYGGYGGLGHNTGQIDHINGVGMINLSYSKTLQNRVWSINGYSVWEDSYGAINVTKSGNVVTFVFSDNRDYQLYLNNYQYLQSTALFTDYSPDPLSVKHYRYIQMTHRMAPFGCGDAYTTNSFSFHVTSSVVFSGGNTLTVTIANVANGYPQEECNNAWSNIQSQINSLQSSINQADYSGVTYCRPVAPIGYSAGYESVLNNPMITYASGSSVSAYSSLTVPCQSMPNFCDWTSPNNFWLFTFFYLRVTITAARDVDNNFLEDPRENFEVYSMLNENGCYVNSNQRLLYKKVNGVEVTNILPAF